MSSLHNADCPLSCASIEDAGLVWFPGLGFRPAVWTPPHRADEVDPPRLVPAPDADVAYIGGKYDAPAGYAWGTWIPQPAAPAPSQITSASLTVAPVPIEAGAGAFLLAAIGALFARKVWAAMSAFGDWFTAERGTGPHQNGWL